jgi:hypothetical protein
MFAAELLSNALKIIENLNSSWKKMGQNNCFTKNYFRNAEN